MIVDGPVGGRSRWRHAETPESGCATANQLGAGQHHELVAETVQWCHQSSAAPGRRNPRRDSRAPMPKIAWRNCGGVGHHRAPCLAARLSKNVGRGQGGSQGLGRLRIRGRRRNQANSSRTPPQAAWQNGGREQAQGAMGPSARRVWSRGARSPRGRVKASARFRASGRAAGQEGEARHQNHQAPPRARLGQRRVEEPGRRVPPPVKARHWGGGRMRQRQLDRPRGRELRCLLDRGLAREQATPTRRCVKHKGGS